MLAEHGGKTGRLCSAADRAEHLGSTAVRAEHSGWSRSTAKRTGYSGSFLGTVMPVGHALEDPPKSKKGPRLCPVAPEPSILGCSSSKTDQRAGLDESFPDL